MADCLRRLDWWAQRNDCTTKTEETLGGGKVHHYSWTCGDKEGLLQHFKVEDLGMFGISHITKFSNTAQAIAGPTQSRTFLRYPFHNCRL
jgi:hypothetical protein